MLAFFLGKNVSFKALAQFLKKSKPNIQNNINIYNYGIKH